MGSPHMCVYVYLMLFEFCKHSFLIIASVLRSIACTLLYNFATVN